MQDATPQILSADMLAGTEPACDGTKLSVGKVTIQNGHRIRCHLSDRRRRFSSAKTGCFSKGQCHYRAVSGRELDPPKPPNLGPLQLKKVWPQGLATLISRWTMPRLDTNCAKGRYNEGTRADPLCPSEEPHAWLTSVWVPLLHFKTNLLRLRTGPLTEFALGPRSLCTEDPTERGPD